MKNEFSTGPVFLSAALCGAQGEMTPASLETQFIVAATLHANAIGVGYADLIKDNLAWVLSRMSIEVERLPQINETYSVVTWIESFNRHLSNRNFALLNAEGSPIGYGRSLWACIDIEKRRPASLKPVDVYGDRVCPIAPIPRLGEPQGNVRTEICRFTYSDTDFNRHVNSARYTEKLADCFSTAFHDAMRLRRLDIAYLQEAGISDNVTVRLSEPPEGNIYDAEIATEGTVNCRARLTFEKR